MSVSHAFALSFISYVGCFISCLCLIASYVTFQFIKFVFTTKLYNTYIHCNVKTSYLNCVYVDVTMLLQEFTVRS